MSTTAVEFIGPASDTMLRGVADRLRERNFEVLIVATAAEARAAVKLVAASASGSQLGPYAAGAGTLILVVGSQKIVPDLDAALVRIIEHVQPYEDEQLREQMGVGTMLAKILILEREWSRARTTVILVREPVGV